MGTYSRCDISVKESK